MSTESTYTDLPANEDKFNISKYIEGLSQFIRICNTPMTVAIQGDWGTGKTSIMQMVQKKLEENPAGLHFVQFNTWQYSQFNMEEKLPFSLMNNIIDKLNTQNILKQEGESFKKVLRGIGAVAKKAIYIAADTIVGGELTDTIKNAVEKNTACDEDTAKAIEDLKKGFQACIDKVTGEGENAGRVIIFVDDLDRLQPMKAVEFLESMKIFLDCNNCVFVLAIDYGVVTRGVKAKYGEDFDEEKGRSFFDKIIQVPFKMPVAEYDIAGYVEGVLTKLGVSFNEKTLPLYSDLIRYSIGRNPRSMKRLFNTYSLLSTISSAMDDTGIQGATGQLLLFATLCMQMAFEEPYNELVMQKDNKDALRDLLTSRFTDLSEEDCGKYRIGKAAAERLHDFVTTLVKAMQLDEDESLSEGEVEQLGDVLRLSAATAVGSSGEASEGKRISDFELWKKYKLDEGKISAATLENVERLYHAIRQACPEACGQFAMDDSSRQSFMTRYGGGKFAEIRLSKAHFNLSMVCGDFERTEKAIKAKLTANLAVDKEKEGWLRVQRITDNATVDQLTEFIKTAYDSKK